MNIIKIILIIVKIIAVLALAGVFVYMIPFMLMMVICTAGAGAVAVIPIGIFFASAIFTIIKSIFRKEVKKNLVSTNEPPLSNSLKALDNFVVESYKHGTSREDITEALIRNGWNKQEIDDSFNRSFHGSN